MNFATSVQMAGTVRDHVMSYGSFDMRIFLVHKASKTFLLMNSNDFWIIIESGNVLLLAAKTSGSI